MTAGVQLPIALLLDQAVPDTAAALWCVLSDAAAGRRPPEVASHRELLLAALGRPKGDPKTVTRATVTLRRAGWLSVERRYVDEATRNVYRPADVGADVRCVDVPVAALDALAAGRITPAQLRSLARWLEACDRTGWTRDTPAIRAAGYRTTAVTLKRHRARLVAVGLLEVRRSTGRVAVTQRPGASAPRPVRIKPSADTCARCDHQLAELVATP